jgi:hypothetical protein
MTTRRRARNPRRQAGGRDTASGLPSEVNWGSADAPGRKVQICCHGETVAPTQRQFQFRNLSDDPRLRVRLAGILTIPRGAG